MSLDYGLAETLLMLDAAPIAVADARGWTDWVAEPALPSSTVDCGVALDPNLELLSALKPDVILTTDYLAMVEDRLAAIAPVRRLSIFSEGGTPYPKAVEAALALGELIGDRDRAQRYVAESETYFDVCRERARPFSEKPILLLSFLDPRHVRVYGAPGMYDDVLKHIGLRNAWTEATNYWGFSTIGIEGLAKIGPAFAVADHLPQDIQAVLDQSPLWKDLPSVSGRKIPVLPTVLMFGAIPSARRFAGLLLDALEGAAA
ncbi:ABC transporter substrate-binding protein [Tianweitania sp.]|uniref:ABC transporter substrate-binding protein n=1 Tax=Tianweitania sp. TaxID=2021634 RepID=UPI00289CEF5D|nr:ABC transporter substrate-binding protein [Tianweitania sp.]